jgi:hypothetical protein
MGSLERYFNRKFYKNKKQQKQQKKNLLGVTENGIIVFIIIFKFGQLVEDYHLLLRSKPL